MRIKTRVLAAASSLAVVGGLVAGFGGTASAAGPPPVPEANQTVICNTVVGAVKFFPALVLPGDTTTQTTITFNTKLDGCSASNAGAGDLAHPNTVNMAAGAVSAKGTLNGTGTSCTNLLGPSIETTVIPITAKWKTVAGTAKIAEGSSALSLHSIVGGTFAPGGSWGSAAYGDFQLGGGQSVVGAFTGGDSGHSSSLEASTGQDLAALLTACGSTSGLKQATLGIGHLNLG